MPKDVEPKDSDYAVLVKRLEALETELDLTKEILRQAEEELKRKDQIIEGLQTRLFGSKSERYHPDQELFEFGDAVLGKPEPEEYSSGDDATGGKKISSPSTRSNKLDKLPKNVRVEIVETIIPDEVLANPEDYIEISEEYHDELDVTKADLYFRRTVRKKYKKKDDRTKPPVIAPAPESSIPGTMCGPDLMAMILVDKYNDHLPHYRQSEALPAHPRGRLMPPDDQ